ncbi:serine/threonine-protein kinase [Kribbella lupini]|uniref:non-specific serine/threonine protein kinase n=1 Tax=Kribbella lupini TaxID=291602 RepID=A0ABN2AUI7_9ACTN
MADVFAGRFELIDPIGAGGTGAVWRAWDRRLERLCAAKVLRQRHAGALLRFVREQGVRLDHPNILSPYSWAADDDQALLAMDLVGGGAVSNLLADFGPLPDRYAAELLAQLLGALVQVHAAGLVHRDIKPANLLLEATGTNPPVLRLSDFGIALSLGEPRLTHQGALIGTPGYLAPETLAGSPPAVAQDLYAVGVTAWQLLTGEEPPTTHPLPTPANPTPVWDLVKPLLAADPADRPSAESALAALAPLLADPLETPARTPDQEPIEVFDHLPAVPAAYKHLVAVTPAQSPADAEHSQTPPRPTVAALIPRTTDSPEAIPGGATGAGLSRAAWSKLGRRRVLVGVVGVLVVAGVGGGLLLEARPHRGTPSSGDSSVGPTPTPSRTPSETPPVVPTGPVTRVPNAAVTVGAACGWQEAGSVETTADGTRVECRQQGKTYRWIKAG